ncbi:MAG: hypothetical protein ACPGSD_00075 [Flavobacteriales bacterium]
MTVNEWFINNGSHTEGIGILAKLKYPIRRLINLQEPTESNKDKLRYELEKHRSKVDHSDRILYGSLPQQLRPKYRERNVLFYEKCELKLELNKLPPEAESEALEIQHQIVKIDKRLKQIWKEFDLWANEKIIVELDEEFDVDTFSIKEVYKIKNNLFSKISRRKSTLAKWEKELSKITNKSLHGRKVLMINKKKAELLQLDEQLSQINERIKD